MSYKKLKVIEILAALVVAFILGACNKLDQTRRSDDRVDTTPTYNVPIVTAPAGARIDLYQGIVPNPTFVLLPDSGDINSDVVVFILMPGESVYVKLEPNIVGGPTYVYDRINRGVRLQYLDKLPSGISANGSVDAHYAIYLERNL